MPRHLVAGIFALMTGLALAQDPPAQRANLREFLGLGAAPDGVAAKLGEPLYKENCATCHGPAARGAQGPNLLRSPLVLHDSKGEDIGLVIRKGRSQGGMPAFPDINDSQLYEIAEFLHLQIELAANRGTYRQTYANLRNQVSGDAKQGSVFFQANCTGCHSATGDLASVAAKYPQASVMLSRIAWPTSQQPRSATVTTSSGEIIKGTLANFTDFDVSLRDSNGEYRSWPREKVRVKLEDKLAGHRALLPRYTDADLHNLTAYLVTLK